MALPRPLLGAGVLLLGATLWGFGFLAQRHTVALASPLWALTVRFLIAAPVAVAVGARRLRGGGIRVREAALLGVVLFAAYWTQTAALTRTPVARVALITGLYVVFVPILQPLFGLPRPRVAHWVGALLAVVGMLMLVGAVSAVDVPWNSGDALTLAHALIGACQMLIVGKLVQKADPFALNAWQLVALAVVALPVALILEPGGAVLPTTADALMAFGYLAVFSTVVGFLCQVVGQKHVSPPAAALLMLVETPVGALAAVVVLRESMTVAQACGALVLVVGAGVSLAAELRAARSTR